MKFITPQKDAKSKFTDAVQEVWAEHQINIAIQLIETKFDKIITSVDKNELNNFLIVFSCILDGQKHNESFEETFNMIVHSIGKNAATKNAIEYKKLYNAMNNEWDMNNVGAHLIEYIKKIEFEHTSPTSIYNNEISQPIAT